MQTIGERLEEARKRRGISIREAAEATKIRSDYLHKLESNSFDLNLPEIYVRGFLRNYANYLKLNADKLLTDYKTLAPNEGRSSRRENREVYGRMELGQNQRQGPEAAGATASAEAPAPARPNYPAPAPTDRPLIDPALLLKGAIVVVALLLVVAIVFGIKAIFSGPSKPAATVSPVAAQTITLIATGPVDVQVREDIDGQIIWRGHMEANDTHPLTKRGSLFITATAGRNLKIEMKGKQYPMPFDGYDRARID
jgi:cytoskeleton protein RodZ